MKFYIVIFSFILFQIPIEGKSPHIIKSVDKLEPYLRQNNDTLYLINFWATWCTPCRKEMPALVQINEKYKNEKFKILLVSLDFPNQLQSRVIPFLLSEKIDLECVLLDDPDHNSWIGKIDPVWDGSIPYSMFFRNDHRNGYSQSFNFLELDSIVKLNLQKQ